MTRVFQTACFCMLLSTISYTVLGQDSTRAFNDLPLQEKKTFNRIKHSRISNESFVSQTLNYAALSYASPPFSDWGSPKKGYILSADISPYFVIGGTWMRYPIHITTRFKARIFRERPKIGDSSLPVRTPSYMPGATMYFPFGKMNDETKKIKYFSFSFFHHSNGQDGREFKADGSVNTYNGNFSTNYFEGAYHFRDRIYKKITAPKCQGNKNPYRDFYGRIGYEQHFSTATALKKSYGDNRINATLGWIKVNSYCDEILDVPVTEAYYREKYRFVWTATLIASERNRGLSALKKRINTDFNFHWRIPSSPNASLFAGVGYYGSDPYNIFYEDSYFFFHAGISLGFFFAPRMLGLK